MDAWASAAIAAAAALLSSGLTGAISLRLAAAGRRDRDRAELAAALAAFSYAVDRLRIELGELPPPSDRVTRKLNRVLERRLRTTDWWLRQVSRHTVARSGRRAYDGVLAATNRLLLVAPEDVVDAVRAIHELLDVARPHDDEWKASWTHTRADLLRLSRQAVAG